MNKRSSAIDKKLSGSSKILHFPLSRILIGAFFLGVVYLLSSALLRPVTGLLVPDAVFSRALRALLVSVILLFAYGSLFRHYEKRRVTELLLKKLPKEGLSGAAGGFFLISVSAAVLSLTGSYRVLTAEFNIVNMLAGFAVILGMATAEEIIFRGVLYRIGEEWLGRIPALGFSAVLFGLAHISNDGANILSLLSAVSGSVMLCLAYSVTKRLWLPLFLHAGWNFAQMFYGINISGMNEFAIYAPIKSSLSGPEWLGGGIFGIESSVPAIVSVILVSIALYRFSVGHSLND